MEKRIKKAKELLDSFCNETSRWDCLELKRELRELLRQDKYAHLSQQIEDKIESARESL